MTDLHIQPATTATDPPSSNRKAKAKRIKTRHPGAGPLSHAFLIALCAIWIYPFVWMVSMAFKSQGEALRGGVGLIPEELTPENFTRAWTDAGFSSYTVNTIIIAVSVAALVTIISAAAGYALGRGTFPGRKIIMGVLVVTLFLPRGYTILPVYILVNALGLNNTLVGIILAEAGPAHVISILLFAGYFAKLPKELEEAARVDGTSELRIFLQIMAPLAKPVAATVFIMTFLQAWNSFLIPLVFSLGNPDIRTLGVGMFAFKGEYSTDWAGLSAGATISVVPIIVVFLLLQRYFIEGIAGAVKN